MGKNVVWRFSSHRAQPVGLGVPLPRPRPWPLAPMLHYQLLAIDIDGTLVNSRDELTPGTRAALARAGAAGIHVVLATGRRYSHTLHLVEPLAIDVPLVTASGALVKDPADHRTLYCAVRPRRCSARRWRSSTAAATTCCSAPTRSAKGSTSIRPRPQRKGPELAEYLAVNRRMRPGLAEHADRPAAGHLRRFRHGQPAADARPGKPAARGPARQSSPRTCCAARAIAVSSASWRRRA